MEEWTLFSLGHLYGTYLPLLPEGEGSCSEFHCKKQLQLVMLFAHQAPWYLLIRHTKRLDIIEIRLVSRRDNKENDDQEQRKYHGISLEGPSYLIGGLDVLLQMLSPLHKIYSC